MTDRRFREATYPMSAEDKDELAEEFAEFGYRETSDPNDADRRNFYKVEKWDAAKLHVEALIHASNDLECCRRNPESLTEKARQEPIVSHCCSKKACRVGQRSLNRTRPKQGTPNRNVRNF